MCKDEEDDALSWLQLTLEAGDHTVVQLEDALLEAGAVAVTLSDAVDEPVLEPAPGETPLWRRTLVTGLFDAGTDVETAKHLVCAALGCDELPEARIGALEERDWVRAWMDHFHPMRFGRRLWVVPSCREPPEPEAVNLLLDPGLAFGTGTHPTTRMCLRWIARQASERAANWNRVLDYGCGSGILAIAAAKFGARSIDAVDIDPAAVESSGRNASANGVALNCALPDGAQGLYPLVLANILSAPLKLLAPLLCGHVASGGDLVLAGILERQTDELRQAYAPWIELQVGDAEDGWVLLTGRKA